MKKRLILFVMVSFLLTKGGNYMLELIKPTDTLAEGYPKINAAIQKADQAFVVADNAVDTANNALAVANQSLANSQSVQEQLNQVVINGDSSVEAAQARVNADNTVTYDTLKERLDTEYIELSTELANKADQSEIERLDARIDNACGTNYEEIINNIGTFPQENMPHGIWEELEQREVNIEWFGAVPNDISKAVENQIAIQNAIDYAKANNINQVFIPDAKYYVSGDNSEILTPTGEKAAIKLPTGVKLISRGGSLYLTAPTSGAVALLWLDEYTVGFIKHLNLRQTSGENADRENTIGLYLSGASGNNIFEGMWISHFGKAILLEGGTWNNTFRQVTVNFSLTGFGHPNGQSEAAGFSAYFDEVFCNYCNRPMLLGTNNGTSNITGTRIAVDGDPTDTDMWGLRFVNTFGSIENIAYENVTARILNLVGSHINIGYLGAWRSGSIVIETKSSLTIKKLKVLECGYLTVVAHFIFCSGTKYIHDIELPAIYTLEFAAQSASAVLTNDTTSVSTSKSVPYGESTNRPTEPLIGHLYFDTTIGKLICCKSINPIIWVDHSGNPI